MNYQMDYFSLQKFQRRLHKGGWHRLDNSYCWDMLFYRKKEWFCVITIRKEKIQFARFR